MESTIRQKGRPKKEKGNEKSSLSPFYPREEIITFIRSNKALFNDKYGVSKVGLFGSIARNADTETSDIDIVIEMEPSKKNIHNFLSFKRLLENEFGRPVDLGIESTLKSVVRETIKEEIIYV